MSLVPVVVVIAFVAGAVPWALYASHRFDHRLGVAAVLLVELLAVQFTLVGTALFGIDPQLAVIVVLALLAAGGLIVCLRTRPSRPSRLAIATWVPGLLGGAIWVVVVALAHILPGASPLAWVMNGDGANNMYEAGVAASEHGILLGPGHNAVPIPAAVIALAGMPAGGGFAGGPVLAAQLGVLAASWSAAIVLWCLVSGAVVASLVPADRPRVTAVAAALGSLLPLTAFVGMSIQWGVYNASVAIPLVLLGWLAQFRSDRHPVASLAASGAALTLLLATWSPLAALVAVPVTLVVWRERAKLSTLRGFRPAVLLVALVQFGLWVYLVIVPTLAGQARAFLAEGYGFPSTWALTVILLAVVCGLAVLGRGRLGTPTTWAVIATAIGAVVALAVMVFQARGTGDPFGAYYPTKLSWLVAVVFGTIGLAVGVGLLARLRRAAMTSVVAACATVIALASIFVPGGAAQLADRQPIVMVLGSRMWPGGEHTVDEVLALSDPRSPGLLWGSGETDEGLIDFWVLVTNGAQIGEDRELRAVAMDARRFHRDQGAWQGSNIRDLCEIIAEVPRLTIYSDDPSLESAIAEECPGDATVRPASDR